MRKPLEFYHDFGRADVEKLCRAICAEQNLDPDSLVPETGYENAGLMPLWWRYQADALKFIAMAKASGEQA